MDGDSGVAQQLNLHGVVSLRRQRHDEYAPA